LGRASRVEGLRVAPRDEEDVERGRGRSGRKELSDLPSAGGELSQEVEAMRQAEAELERTVAGESNRVRRPSHSSVSFPPERTREQGKTASQEDVVQHDEKALVALAEDASKGKGARAAEQEVARVDASFGGVGGLPAKLASHLEYAV